MNKDQISVEFDAFFEFGTDDKRTVTSVSCKLFARIILQMSHGRIEQLERELAEAQKDAKRLNYVLYNCAFIVKHNGNYKLTTQDDDEEFHLLGNGKTMVEAVDAAIQEGK